MNMKFSNIKLLQVAILSIIFSGCKDAKAEKEVYRSETLLINKISELVYEHTSYLNTESFGKVPCNGMIVYNKNEAVVFDTPIDNASSAELINWVTKTLKCKIVAIIPTHYHGDNLGGLDEFHKQGITSYAYQRTIQIAEEHGLPVPQNGFESFLELKVGGEKVYADFLGEGHTCDNTIGYFPMEDIMFGGCLVKEVGAGKGNLSEASPSEWSETVRKVKAKYPDVKTIIPGHGKSGGTELLDYTITLFNAQTVEFNHKTGKYIKVDGANIYYEEIENEGKPALLFLHGGFGNIEDFNPILQMFSNDYHIVGIDSRGHGKSTLGTDKLTYKQLQHDVEAIVNHLHLKNSVIIGYSDGGVIAYRLAAANRISIQKIVTIGGTWSLSDAELMEKIMANTAPKDCRNYFKQSFEFHQQYNPQPDFDKFAKCVIEMWTDKTESGYPQASVENILVPVLIIRGNDDYMFPLESAVEFTAKVKNSSLLNIPFAPHGVFRKYPQIFEIVTRDFLNEHEK